MVQKRNELSEFRDRIGEYSKNIGEQMTFTSVRLNKIEATMNEILKEIESIKENSKLDRKEFRDTTCTLVESLKELAQLTIEVPKAIIEEDDAVFTD